MYADSPEAPEPTNMMQAATARLSPIPAALDEARDRLARTDAILEDLHQTVSRLATVLEPVLTDGSPVTYPSDPEPGLEGGTPEDRRSTIARNIADLADHAHRQGDAAAEAIRRLRGLLEAVEA